MRQRSSTSLVVDTSAAAAIIFDERGHGDLVGALEAALERLMSAATRVELGIVVEARLWLGGQDVVDRFVRDARIEVVPVDVEQSARALSAWRRYGKGHHEAGLNFGDCFAYALAEQTGYPLLCTGGDFPATDIALAWD